MYNLSTSEQSKRARRIFGKVFQSKMVRVMKNDRKKTNIIFYSEREWRARKIFG